MVVVVLATKIEGEYDGLTDSLMDKEGVTVVVSDEVGGTDSDGLTLSVTVDVTLGVSLGVVAPIGDSEIEMLIVVEIVADGLIVSLALGFCVIDAELETNTVSLVVTVSEAVALSETMLLGDSELTAVTLSEATGVIEPLTDEEELGSSKVLLADIEGELVIDCEELIASDSVGVKDRLGV